MKSGQTNASAKERAEQAYQTYLQMGNERSLEGLRKKMHQKYSKNTPIDTLKSWSKKYGWQYRIAQSIQRAQVKANAVYERSLVAVKKRQEQLVNLMYTGLLEQFKRQREAGVLPEFDYTDMLKTMMHELQLRGIIKEAPPVVNQMAMAQVVLSPHEEFLKKTLMALPGDIRDIVSRTMYNLRKEEKARAIEMQPREVDILETEGHGEEDV